MSGLETVGIIANVVQVTDFSTKLLRRISEYGSKATELPEAFRHVSVELPLLLDTLEHFRKNIEANVVSDQSKKALEPVMKNCRNEIVELGRLIDKALPKDGDGGLKRGWKAVGSLRYSTLR